VVPVLTAQNGVMWHVRATTLPNGEATGVLNLQSHVPSVFVYSSERFGSDRTENRFLVIFFSKVECARRLPANTLWTLVAVAVEPI
jgi:hypothetical protein